MLFDIVNLKRTANDEKFKQYIEYIRDAFKADKGLGQYVFSEPVSRVKSISLPFTEWFNGYFKREDIDDDKKAGNHNHFVNVVAAMARLIMYFQDKDNVINIIKKPTKYHPEDLEPEKIVYNDRPDKRTFTLMLAAFFHDIGKAVMDPRHGMEGAIILADHTTRSLYQINRIADEYNLEEKFERDDLMYISDMVYYHYLFGTLATGESGFLGLVDLVDRIKQYSLKYMHVLNEQTDCSYQCLFDLWLLNIADIIASVDDKWAPQEVWMKKESADKFIMKFFDRPLASSLVHDLRMAFRLLKTHNRETHTDDTTDVARIAQQQSRHHVAQRVRRLITTSLQLAMKEYEDETETETEKGIRPEMKDIIYNINNLSVGYKHSTIIRCIQSIADSREFCDRFSWIGSLDYSFGFFEKIALKTFKNIEEEISNSKITHWIRPKVPGDDFGDSYLNNINAQFIFDNYSTIVIRILSHLLFREQSINRLRNMEFKDAVERLIEDKIEKIIAMEGPYRANRAIQLILQTIFIY